MSFNIRKLYSKNQAKFTDLLINNPHNKVRSCTFENKNSVITMNILKNTYPDEFTFVEAGNILSPITETEISTYFLDYIN